MKKINFLQAFLIFLLILSVGIGSGYLILYYLTPQTQIGQLVARVLILLVAGIGIGLVCRLAIPSRIWFLKICFAVIGGILSILSLDWFFPTTYALLHDRTFNIEWWSVGEYTQIGCLLCATIFIAIIGKKKPISVQREISNPEPKKIVQKRKSATSPVRSAVKKKTKQNAVSLTALAKKKLVKKTTRPKKVAAKPILKNAAPAIKVKATGKTSLKKKKATTTRTRSRNNNVKLTGTEDHRCPYCLEEVHKNDPRGIVICPDCGTWHHRDCWEITGSCQIAHKHEL